MSDSRAKKKATTIYLEPGVAQAIRIKAAVSGRTLSELANEGLRRLLREDQRLLRVFREREHGTAKAIPYEDVLRDLKRRGLL